MTPWIHANLFSKFMRGIRAKFHKVEGHDVGGNGFMLYGQGDERKTLL
jgi:hypothetical protein